MKIRPSLHPQTVVPSSTMADIAFLLIIFFMLSMSFAKDKIPVSLPDSRIMEELPTSAITITLTISGDTFWNDKKVVPPVLKQWAKLEIAHDQFRYFILRADKDVLCKRVNETISLLRNAGVQNICLPVIKEHETS